MCIGLGYVHDPHRLSRRMPFVGKMFCGTGDIVLSLVGLITQGDRQITLRGCRLITWGDRQFSWRID